MSYFTWESLTKLNGNYAKAIVGELYEVFDIITNTHSEKIRITANKADEIWDALVVVEKKAFYDCWCFWWYL